MGEILALGSALSWALTTIAMRPIAGRALLQASLIRMLVGSALLLAYSWPSGAAGRALAATPSTWAWLVGSVLGSLVVGDSLYFAASARIGVTRALPIASSFPLLTTAGAVLLLGEPATAPVLVGSLLIVGGIWAIIGDYPATGVRRDGLGLAWAGLAALCWATSGLMLRPALDELDPVAANLIRFPVGAVLFAVPLAVRRPRWHLQGRQLWLAVAGGIGTVVSALLYLAGIALAGVARAVLLNATSPVFSAILAWWLLRERLTARAALGVGLSALGSALLVL